VPQIKVASDKEDPKGFISKWRSL